MDFPDIVLAGTSELITQPGHHLPSNQSQFNQVTWQKVLSWTAMQCGRCDLQYKGCRNLGARGARNPFPGSGCYFCTSSSESGARSRNSSLRSKVCKIASRLILNWCKFDKCFFLGMQIGSPQWRCLIRVPVRRCYRVSNIST